MMNTQNNLLLAYYGDDFTGSTDALESLSRAGAKTVLFIEPPTAGQLARYPGLRAIGVAGRSRSMAPAEMEQELRPAFLALKALGARHVHYKVCSTFDSSPVIGSIGKAIDIAAEIFQAPFVPLLVGAPALGRHCVFGNLFARLGIGSTGKIFRLDRHPSMSRHPVTPAEESDLRLHLSKQTTKSIGLVDILQVVLPKAEAAEVLQGVIENGAEIVLFDALYQEQMKGIGALIDKYADPQKPLFSAGSSGIEMALGEYWIQKGLLQPVQEWKEPGNSGPLLVASGSCSPVTSGQITWALANGFAEIALDTAVIVANHGCSETIKKHVKEAVSLINGGTNVILHTSRGNDDERVTKTAEIFAGKGFDEAMIQATTSRLFGSALGEIVRAVAEQTSLKRIVIAGGDTSSYVGRALGIEAVEMIAPLTPGAPLCKAHAPGSPVDGLEVNFKGGQVGSKDYFGMLFEGKELR
jgi:uncharacterized protein YgbK (DUF1537 family)